MCTEIAKVTRPHSSTSPEQLNLENGQLILILSKNVSGWWLGELQVSVSAGSEVLDSAQVLSYSPVAAWPHLTVVARPKHTSLLPD